MITIEEILAEDNPADKFTEHQLTEAISNVSKQTDLDSIKDVVANLLATENPFIWGPLIFTPSVHSLSKNNALVNLKLSIRINQYYSILQHQLNNGTISQAEFFNAKGKILFIDKT